MDIEYTDEDNLSPEQVAHITELMRQIAMIASQAGEPIDPKVEVTLELAHAMLGEQIKMDKIYVWGSAPEQDDRFLNPECNIEMPTDDELREMMGGDTT